MADYVVYYFICMLSGGNYCFLGAINLLEAPYYIPTNKDVEGLQDVSQKRKCRKQQDVVIRVNWTVYPIRMIKGYFKVEVK